MLPAPPRRRRSDARRCCGCQAVRFCGGAAAPAAVFWETGSEAGPHPRPCLRVSGRLGLTCALFRIGVQNWLPRIQSLRMPASLKCARFLAFAASGSLLEIISVVFLVNMAKIRWSLGFEAELFALKPDLRSVVIFSLHQHHKSVGSPTSS